MWKPSKNPKVEELTKSYKGRSYPLSNFGILKLDGINKNCNWCLGLLSGKRQKWCSESCIRNVLAWARPQSGYGLRILLKDQKFECATCHLSYGTHMSQVIQKIKNYKRFQFPRMKSKRIDMAMRMFRRSIPRNIRPEVDHIIPISMGGISLGLSNHRILCAACHKEKTKNDLRNKHSLYGHPLKGRKFSSSHIASLSAVRKGFDSENRKTAREQHLYPPSRKRVIAVNISTGEEITFRSHQEAADKLNLQACNIGRVLRNDQNRKQHKGWTFKHE